MTIATASARRRQAVIASAEATAPAAVPAGRSIRPVPRWWRDTSGAAMWLILLFATALWVQGGGLSDLGSLAGFLDSLGRITGMIGSALLLVQVFLMARVPWIEQAWGQDRLTRTHRLVGFTSFNLVVAHVVLITLGYAAASPAGLWGTIVDLTLNYPGMLLAIAGTLALCLIVATSIKAARAKLRYESWHLLHLYAYLGAGLALPHQLWTGSDFLDSTAATVFWWGIYGLSLGAVLLYRIAIPLSRSRRSVLRVVDVRSEAPDVTTVTVRGAHVERLGAQAGQFFTWRFLGGPGWTRGQPYSLSAAPTPTTLRITARHVGDGSARLATLKPGARVLVEGPYGRLHAGVRTRPKVLLMGAGIGITPMRSLLEAMPQAPGDVTVLQRVSSRDELLLATEIDALAAERGARYVVVEGHRIPSRPSWLPIEAAHLSDVEGLRQLVPDVASYEVYICGSAAWMAAAEDAVLLAGVPRSAIHIEHFSF